MPKYLITGEAYTSVEFDDIEAKNAEEAIKLAEEMMEGLCWHCSNVYDIGEFKLYWEENK